MKQGDKLKTINTAIERCFTTYPETGRIELHKPPEYLSALYNIRQHLLNTPDPDNRGPNTNYRFRNVIPSSLKITPNGNAITIEFTEYE